ncbi:hypothetical protein V6615_01825 [Oscillospiraceae bacterium PP1C4]
MDIMERINILKGCGITDETAHSDLVNMVQLMKEQFDITLTEENAGVMVTHFAAAFKRNRTGETVEPLAEVAVESLQEDPSYDKACTIFAAISDKIENIFSKDEQLFALLHLCTLINEINA